MKKNKEEIVVWKFQWGETFGFLIPEDRDYYGWDFFIKRSGFWLAQDWDKVEGTVIPSTWKKPEVKITKVFWRGPVVNSQYVEGLYSKWDWNFGFIDVEWQEKGFFVYGDKRNGATDWEKVKAEIVEFNGRKEAVVVKVFADEYETITWRFKDSDRFGFVIPDEGKNNDVFIAGSRKNWAKDGQMVEAKIVKKWGKNPEWVVTKILD